MKSKTGDQIRAERRQLKAQYGDLFDATSVLLFRHDPVGINFETNTDEYDPEVGTILPRIRTCQSADDVRQVVHEEFDRWFGASSAGPKEHYIKIAEDIWQLWQKFKTS